MIGMPSPSAAWTRIWWVRPVSGKKATSARPFLRWSSFHRVSAGLPEGSPRMRQPSSAVEVFISGKSIVPLSSAGSRLGLAREQKAAAGIAIEPVDRLGQPPEPEGQVAEHVLEAARAVARAIDRQPRGLVDDDRLAVDEEDAILKHGTPIASHARM